MIEESWSEYDKNDNGEQRGDILGFLRQAQAKEPERPEYQNRQIASDLSVNM